MTRRRNDSDALKAAAWDATEARTKAKKRWERALARWEHEDKGSGSYRKTVQPLAAKLKAAEQREQAAWDAVGRWSNRRRNVSRQTASKLPKGTRVWIQSSSNLHGGKRHYPTGAREMATVVYTASDGNVWVTTDKGARVNVHPTMITLPGTRSSSWRGRDDPADLPRPWRERYPDRQGNPSDRPDLAWRRTQRARMRAEMAKDKRPADSPALAYIGPRGHFEIFGFGVGSLRESAPTLQWAHDRGNRLVAAGIIDGYEVYAIVNGREQVVGTGGRPRRSNRPRRPRRHNSSEARFWFISRDVREPGGWQAPRAIPTTNIRTEADARAWARSASRNAETPVRVFERTYSGKRLVGDFDAHGRET